MQRQKQTEEFEKPKQRQVAVAVVVAVKLFCNLGGKLFGGMAKKTYFCE